MKRLIPIAGVLLLFAATGQMKAAVITPVVEYASAFIVAEPNSYTIGYAFTTSTSFTVNALGYLADGLGNNHQVAIWDSLGNLVVSTTVLGTDAITGHFRYGSIADFLLGPGAYVIGGEYLGGGLPIGATGVTTLPGYTYIEDRFLFGSGLNFPTGSNGGSVYGDNGIALVTFSVNTAVAAPEIDPSSGVRAFTLLFGVLLVLFGRRKKEEIPS